MNLIVSEFLTLDGVMQAPGATDEDRSGGFEHGGWQMPYFDEAAGNAISEGMATAGGFLLGRRPMSCSRGSGRRSPTTTPSPPP